MAKKKKPAAKKKDKPQSLSASERNRLAKAGSTVAASASAADATSIPDAVANLLHAAGVGDEFIAAQNRLIENLGIAQSFAATASATSVTDPGSQLGNENIVGIDIGEKISESGPTGHRSIRIFVKQKASLTNVANDTQVPDSIDGIPTDVIQVGDIVAQNRKMRRPAICGGSVGHKHITAGTIGCLCVSDDNKLCILSNNHVLANVNEASAGDIVLQPGPVDILGSVKPEHIIGELTDFIHMNSTGNIVDAAIAQVFDGEVSPEHFSFKLDPDPDTPAEGMSVKKDGRTTSFTKGEISGLNALVNVRYSPFINGQVQTVVLGFKNQITIRGTVQGKVFSRPGDSGSIVVNSMNNRPVGLLFAGDETQDITWANPIQHVISELALDRLVGGDEDI